MSIALSEDPLHDGPQILVSPSCAFVRGHRANAVRNFGVIAKVLQQLAHDVTGQSSARRNVPAGSIVMQIVKVDHQSGLRLICVST